MVYSQAPQYNVNNGTYWTSSALATGTPGVFNFGYATYDDFTLSQTTAITEITWYGDYLNSAPNTTSWDIRIDASVPSDTNDPIAPPLYEIDVPVSSMISSTYG